MIGETPYAEGYGDTDDLSLAKEDVEAVLNMKKAGIPTVVMLFSGRPMIIMMYLISPMRLLRPGFPEQRGRESQTYCLAITRQPESCRIPGQKVLIRCRLMLVMERKTRSFRMDLG